MKPYLGWERGYLPFNIAPVPAEVLPDGSTVPTNPPATDPVTDPEFNEEEGDGPDDDDVKALRLLVLARQRSSVAKAMEDSSSRAAAAGAAAQIEREFAQFRMPMRSLCRIGGPIGGGAEGSPGERDRPMAHADGGAARHDQEFRKLDPARADGRAGRGFAETRCGTSRRLRCR